MSPSLSRSPKTLSQDQSMNPPLGSANEAATEEEPSPSFSPTLSQRVLVSSTKKPAVPPCRPPWLIWKRFDWGTCVEVFEMKRSSSPSRSTSTKSASRLVSWMFGYCALVSSTNTPVVPPCRPPWLTHRRFWSLP